MYMVHLMLNTVYMCVFVDVTSFEVLRKGILLEAELRSAARTSGAAAAQLLRAATAARQPPRLVSDEALAGEKGGLSSLRSSIFL